MHRFLLVLTAFALAAPSIGCQLCSNPFDYCGPTSIGGRFEPCNPCARAGSILAPGPQYVPGQMDPDKPHGPTVEAEVNAVSADFEQLTPIFDATSQDPKPKTFSRVSRGTASR